MSSYPSTDEVCHLIPSHPTDYSFILTRSVMLTLQCNKIRYNTIQYTFTAKWKMHNGCVVVLSAHTLTSIMKRKYYYSGKRVNSQTDKVKNTGPTSCANWQGSWPVTLIKQLPWRMVWASLQVVWVTLPFNQSGEIAWNNSVQYHWTQSSKTNQGSSLASR